jgi:hypothetical protein
MAQYRAYGQAAVVYAGYDTIHGENNFAICDKICIPPRGEEYGIVCWKRSCRTPLKGGMGNRDGEESGVVWWL